LEIDGETSSRLLQFFYSFHNQPSSVRQLCYTGEKLSYLVSVESFEFLTPSKTCLRTTARTTVWKSNRKKHTRGLNLILIKEVPWRFTWRPQRAIRRIGASDPPLYSCKKLECSLKSNAAEPTIFLVLIQILEAVPPSKRTPEHIFSGTNRVKKESVKVRKSPQIVQKVSGRHPDPDP
jgi:hypothetical protein